MSIYNLREGGLKGVTMSYEDGGKTEVWVWRDNTVRVPAGSPQEEVKRRFREDAQ